LEPELIQHVPVSVPNAGSFIRYSPATVDTGVSFIKALESKYIDDLSSSSTTGTLAPKPAIEAITLGSSNGRIEVEAPGIDKVRAKISRVERLKELSLDGQKVAFAADGEDDTIARMCMSS
jgi:hypothetical protein